MADQPYTPTEARVCIDYCNAAVARRKADPSIGMAEADAEFDRFIEAVKRDAAREALDGLAAEVRLEWHERHHWVLQPIDGYRNDSYPEETP